MAEANMQVFPEQGAFMAFLIELMGAKRCLEIGVFTGYSALAVALALPDDGWLLACDVNEKWTAMARSYWAEAGVKEKIHLHLAPAIKTLDDLLADLRAHGPEVEAFPTIPLVFFARRTDTAARAS